MKRLTALLVSVPATAFAHPGDHSHTGLFHFVTEPDHLAMLGIGVALVAYIAFKLRARR